MTVQTHRRRQRRALPAALLALVVVLLSACGARIDTQLTVDRSGAGTRVMTLTLASNQDSILGGVEALDASIRRHKPDAIDYSGITSGPGGEWIATFTVTFADPQEYRDKMIALLAASDQTWSQDYVFVVEDSMFVSGITIDEGYSSADLLRWMFNGLLVDGVVDESDQSNMWENGDTVVVYDGVAYDEYTPIYFSEMSDRGFDSVRMETVLGHDGYERAITYWLDDKAVYNSLAENFDGFFEGLGSAGIAVEQDTAGIGVTWVAMFSADTPEGLADLTDTALMSESTEFEVTSGPLPDDPATFSMTVVDYAECAAICSPEAGTIIDTLVAPAEYELWSGHYTNESGDVELAMDGYEGTVEYQVVHMFDEVTTDLTIGLTGDLTWTVELLAGPETVEAVGVGLAEMLAWADGEGSVDVEESEEGTTYTVTISGGDVDAFLESYEAWSGRSTSLAKVDLGDASFFTEHYALGGDLELPSPLDRHVYGGSVRTTVHTPFGLSVDAASWPSRIDGEDGYTFSGTSFNLVLRGTSLAGFIIYANLALILVVAVTLLVVFRKRIARAVARRREAAAARRAEAAAAGLAAPGGLATLPPPGAPVGDAGEAALLAGESPTAPLPVDGLRTDGSPADGVPTAPVSVEEIRAMAPPPPGGAPVEVAPPPPGAAPVEVVPPPPTGAPVELPPPPAGAVPVEAPAPPAPAPAAAEQGSALDEADLL